MRTNPNISWEKVGDELRRLEACAKDVCDTYQDFEVECIAGELIMDSDGEWSSSGAHIANWSMPDGLQLNLMPKIVC